MVSVLITLRKHNMGTITKLFRQSYSKLSNTREQLFHAWRSFTFDEIQKP